MSIHRAVIVLGVAAGLSAIPSFATTLTPGGLVSGSAVTVTQVGSALASSSGTIVAKTYSADYTESVVYDSSNPFNSSCGGSGCLTFLFQVTNLTGSANGIEHITDGDGGTGFVNYHLNVGYETGAGSAPITIGETLFGTVSFDYPGGDALKPGTGTDTLVVQTDSSHFEPGLFSAIDSSTGTVPGYVPMASTPEPASLTLLGTGLVGVVAARRRRGSRVRG